MTPREWSRSERAVIFRGVGVYGMAWFRRRVEGRSDAAIRAMAWRMFGSGGLTRGAYTLARACRHTGYARSQLTRARDALAQKWQRTSATGSYLIYEDQLDEVVTWLRKDYWSAAHRLYGCSWCDTTERPHRGQGLCSRCFDMHAHLLYRAGLPVACADLARHLRKCKLEVAPEIMQSLVIGRAPDHLLMIRMVRRSRSC